MTLCELTTLRLRLADAMNTLREGYSIEAERRYYDTAARIDHLQEARTLTQSQPLCAELFLRNPNYMHANQPAERNATTAAGPLSTGDAK